MIFIIQCSLIVIFLMYEPVKGNFLVRFFFPATLILIQFILSGRENLERMIVDAHVAAISDQLGTPGVAPDAADEWAQVLMGFI